MSLKILQIRASEAKTPLIGLIKPSILEQEFNIYLPGALYDDKDAFCEDLRWYIEDYARNDPFSSQRSRSVESRLQSYGLSLAHAICKSEATPADFLDSALLIEIDGYGGYSSRLSRIHWEILEDLNFWSADVRPCRVSVVRKIAIPDSVNETRLLLTTSAEPDPSANAQHILALTARPTQGADIPHRMITRCIFEAVQSSKSKAATFEIVRPGTFQALQEALFLHEPGYYGLVHLDLHGFVEEGRAFLKFLHSKEESSGADDIPTDEIAKLLSARGVRIVVINACESASEKGPDSSIVRSIVEAGVSMAVGMRYQVLESAAEIFTQSFYRSLLNCNQSINAAMHAARTAMRNCQKRKTKFNTEVNVLDAIMPILISRVVSGDPRLFEVGQSWPLIVPQSEPTLYGREDDILSLETRLVASNVLLLKGSAGTGKTYLMQHLGPWWKTTGFVKDHVIIDCSRMGTLNAFKLRLAIAHAFSLTSSDETIDVMSVLNQTRYLIVLDNLDVTKKLEEAKSREKRLSLRHFLRKIKKTFIVLVSRYDEDWAKAAARVTYQLNNLDMKSSLQLASRMIADKSSKADLTNHMEFRFLEQCITLVDGNPLAIKLLLRAFDPTRSSIQAFYRQLTDGNSLDEARPGLLAADGERGFIDAQRLVRVYAWVHGSAPFRDVDFKLLRPFWRTFPLDLGPYRLLFLRCKNRVSRKEYDEPKVLPSQLKPSAESMDNDEWPLFQPERYFRDSELASLRSMEESFNVCERAGFMTKIVAEADGEPHIRLHPLMSLALKQREFAPPEWLDHVVKVAFHRFYSYRSRHWPSTGIITSVWDLPRAQLAFEFANFITANNYSLHFTPTDRSVFLMKPSLQVSQGLSSDARRLSIIFDFLERFLQRFGAPLSEHKPSTSTTLWAFGLDKLKKPKSVQRDPLSKNRGMLEMLCILAIMPAANLANILGLKRNYSPMLEGIASNISPQNEFAEVSLLALKNARLVLHHINTPGAEIDENIRKIIDHKRQISQENEDPGPKSRGPGAKAVDKIYSRMTFATLDKITAAKTVEEIQALERELLSRLEDLLDEEDSIRAKAGIYEGLAALAFKREDYTAALQHIDTAINLANSAENTSPQELQSLENTRWNMFAAYTTSRISAENTPEEVQELEKALLDSLEDLLQKENFVQAKQGIYEGLAALAFKRKDFLAAILHIDASIDLARKMEGVSPQALQSLEKVRGDFLAAYAREELFTRLKIVDSVQSTTVP